MRKKFIMRRHLKDAIDERVTPMIKCCDWYEAHKGGDARLRQALLIIQSWLRGKITADLALARRIIDEVKDERYDSVAISASLLLEAVEAKDRGVNEEIHIWWILRIFDEGFGFTWMIYTDWNTKKKEKIP